MSVVRWICLFALTIACFVTAPILVLLALPFAKQDSVNILPSWLQWLNTYDDLGCDQGTHVENNKPVSGKYEQQVKDVFDTYGWYAKTWYWLGIRNQMYTLFHNLAPHVTNPILKEVTDNWTILRVVQDGRDYFCYLNRHVDIGWGWKLFNADYPTFYFRFRFWKSPSN